MDICKVKYSVKASYLLCLNTFVFEFLIVLGSNPQTTYDSNGMVRRIMSYPSPYGPPPLGPNAMLPNNSSQHAAGTSNLNSSLTNSSNGQTTVSNASNAAINKQQVIIYFSIENFMILYNLVSVEPKSCGHDAIWWNCRSSISSWPSW